MQILYYSELYCIYSPVLHALMIQYSSYCAMAPDTALFKPALELFSLPLPTENPTTFGLNSLMISVHQSIKTLVLAHAYQIILILIYTHVYSHSYSLYSNTYSYTHHTLTWYSSNFTEVIISSNTASACMMCQQLIMIEIILCVMELTSMKHHDTQ